MPTNYLFAGLRPQNTPQIKTSFSQATQDLNSGVQSRAVSPQQTAQTSPFSTSLVGDTVSLQSNKNQQLNQFGQDITTMQQMAQQKRQQEEQARQAAQAQAVRTSGPQDSTYNSKVTPVGNTVYSGPASGARQQLVSQAEDMLGTPYAWGGGGYGNRGSRGTGLGTQNVIGVDCSGLTSYVYSTLGIRLPRTSQEQLRTAGYKTAVQNLAPGDLVGWTSNNGGHVAMWIGGNRILESPKPGATVRIRNLTDGDIRAGVYGVHIKLPGE